MEFKNWSTWKTEWVNTKEHTEVEDKEEENKERKKKNIDPRWDKLKQLLTDK
jgi:uncharacterized metal-binding protein YceD (DUF177 family)